MRPAELAARIERSQSEILVAFDLAAKPIGFAAGASVYTPFHSMATFELWALFVESSSRRQGIGTKLLQEVRELARSLSCYDIRVSAIPEVAIENFYAAAGYRLYASRLRYTFI